MKPALEDLAARYKGIIETSIGDVIAALLARTAAALEAVPVPALPAELEARCAAWESLFEAERATVASATRERRAAKATDDELLAAIYAAPHDDGPRHVFADALLERGDARVEFILLQLAKARGDATPEQLVRERALLRDAKRLAAWGLPLSAAGDVTFARGFPAALILGAKQGKKAAGHDALRTLERLENLQGVSRKLAVELLSSPQLAGLQHAGQLEAALFDAVPGSFGWTSVALAFGPSPGQLARLPRLTTLALTTTEGFSGSATLEALVTHQGRAFNPALLVALPSLVAFTATQFVQDWPSAGRFDALPRVERLAFRNAPPPTALQGCGASSFECHWSRDLDLPGVVAALPKLRRLALLGNYTPADVRAAAVDATRTRGFERLGLGMVVVERPFASDAVIELRLSSFEVDRVKEVLAALPRDVATRLVVRPPSLFAPAPAAELVDAVAAVLGLPTEVAWY